MVPLLTAREMREMDRLTIEEIGVPSLVLMETAGRAVAHAIHDRFGAGASTLVVSGLGNNGGDGVVIARHLANQGHEVSLVLLGDPSRASRDLAAQLAIAEKLGLDPVILRDGEIEDELPLLLVAHEVIVDAIFGTGLSRPVEGDSKRAIELINDADCFVVSVDLPSGIDADTGQVLGVAVRSELSVTFALPKLGHALYPGRAHSGEVLVIDIGIPYSLLEQVKPRAELLDDSILDPLRVPRDPDSHKGSYGHLLVVAGIPDRPGAALLAGRAGLRVGTGLVTLASDDETVRRLAPALEELMGLALGSPHIEAARALEALGTRSALAIGPSLVATEEISALVREVLLGSALPVVVDAGALEALGERPGWLASRTGQTVLTPHPGEMARLLGSTTAKVQADRPGAVRDLAALSGATVVLKGAATVIADPDGFLSVIGAGNPGMASGGMGDVLTGVIGGLLAQGFEARAAARVGAMLHASAADRALARRSEAGLVAGDVLDELVQPLPSGEDCQA